MPTNYISLKLKWSIVLRKTEYKSENLWYSTEFSILRLTFYGKSASKSLRTYATKYFPHWNIFNTLHTVCFMHGLSIFELKRICHRAYFFRITYWSLQHLTNFQEIYNNNTSPNYRAKTVVIFSQLLSFNLNYCPWPQTFKKMCMFTCYPMLWQDTAWCILAIRRKNGICF